MKADNIKHERNRAELRDNHLRHIIDWGEKNDYPQTVMDIVGGSHTGTSCLDKYQKFIYGRGFADHDNYQLIVNPESETADDLLLLLANDYAMFGGFAAHVNRNMLGQVVSVRHIPLENIRRCIEDDPEFAGKVAVHPDWGHRTNKPFNKTPIEYFYLYDPDLYTFLDRVNRAGGISEYKGEIVYFSNRRGNYPIPMFDSVLTDMSTQEGIANVTYRNVRRGFMSAGCFAEINDHYDDNNENDKAAFDAVSKAIEDLQGDEKSQAIIHVSVPNKDAIPQFVSMRGENYDKEFTVSTDAARLAIGQAFCQPQELRCEVTTSGFSNDAMVQAYRVYNSTTDRERLTLERFFSRLFKQWYIQIDYNFQILPLSYGSESIISRIGSDKAKDVVELATNNEIDINQRKSLLILLYGLEEDEVNQILLLHAN